MLTGVVAGLVVEVNAHPAGNFIRLATVDIGQSTKVQIVFGGPDLVEAGDFVPVALPGARLPGRKKMRRAKFRGQTSYGMLCSAAELGWEPGGPDEVALLKTDGLRPGSTLDDAKWPDIQAELKPNHLELRRRWENRLAVRSGDDVTLDELVPCKPATMRVRTSLSVLHSTTELCRHSTPLVNRGQSAKGSFAHLLFQQRDCQEITLSVAPQEEAELL